ncbi:MAG: cupin domain-containing protein [Microbacterium sp.]
MTPRMPAGAATVAATLAIVHELVDPDKIIAGSPTTGIHEFDETTGVWEMSPGAMSDVEEDEVFVVLTGDATVEFIEPALPSVELRPGSVLRLEAGMRTVWTVHETLRKVYVAL